MQAVAEMNPYVEGFEGLLAARSVAEPRDLVELRRRAMERFEALGFPTLRMERWRHTNVAPIAKAGFAAASAAGSVSLDELTAHLYEGTGRLVFVDGFFAPELSTGLELPAGVVATSLAEALERRPDEVMARLGKQVGFEDQAFAALNTAYFRDGAYLSVPPGTVLQQPLHLLFVATTEESANYPRSLVVLGDGSQATVVESYVGLGERRYLTCPVTEVALGKNAVLDHYKVQRESLEGFHVAVQQSWQDRDSTLRSHSVSIGGALVRNDLNGVLDGEGVSCTLNGLYLADGKQHVDNHMRMDHAKPHGYSHELYKGVLNGSARSVFNGLIHVHPGAQKTDAVQSNRNLLLSKNALAHSNPQLEIFADDVRCTHGSTIGQLDADAVFYLRSRGIAEDAARSLLTYAFASDIVDRIKVDSVRQDLEEYLFRRLPQGEVVRQAF